MAEARYAGLCSGPGLPGSPLWPPGPAVRMVVAGSSAAQGYCRFVDEEKAKQDPSYYLKNTNTETRETLQELYREFKGDEVLAATMKVPEKQKVDKLNAVSRQRATWLCTGPPPGSTGRPRQAVWAPGNLCWSLWVTARVAFWRRGTEQVWQGPLAVAVSPACWPLRVPLRAHVIFSAGPLFHREGQCLFHLHRHGSGDHARSRYCLCGCYQRNCWLGPARGAPGLRSRLGDLVAVRQGLAF